MQFSTALNCILKFSDKLQTIILDRSFIIPTLCSSYFIYFYIINSLYSAYTHYIIMLPAWMSTRDIQHILIMDLNKKSFSQIEHQIRQSNCLEKQHSSLFKHLK